MSLAIRRDGAFERLYAIKRLHAEVLETASAREAFSREARIAGLVRHPNVVSVLSVGRDEDGPFLVMDWIDGVPLHALLGRLLESGPVPIALACRIAEQVARGLHAAHQLVTHTGEHLELVHRDVSPQNVLVGFDGLVRVTDFGIAKALSGDSPTATGVVKGKAGYLSPEQLGCEVVDRRADLFSLGIVLFEALSGRRLYHDRGVGALGVIAERILHEPPPSIAEERRDAPPALDELLFELLAKDRSERPSTALEVARRLAAIAEHTRDEDEPDLEAILAARFEPDRAALRARIAAALQAVHAGPEAAA
ncbi:MAG: serine/threonine protein kinase, partial [Myxococcota bacterium]|nr:serine/threonine protein kinase [Myxococcota bacterium]